MGTQVVNEHETNDVQDALPCFTVPTMPRLFDTSGTVDIAEELLQGQATSDHSDSPRPRSRRGVSMAQKQASNREHQRRFRERSKVIAHAVSRNLLNKSRP